MSLHRNGASLVEGHPAYRPDIDGLRAVAVIPVILFHAGFPLFSGGYVGVDVFFVISGYLITSIIAREIELGTFTVAGFYDRRCRRILPALTTMLVLCFAAAWFLMLPSQYVEFADLSIFTSLFGSNLFFWKSSDYFSASLDFMPLLHTWSLGVEEQYYITFPVFMLVAARLFPRALIWILVAAALGTFAVDVYAAYHHPVAAFYLSPLRAWELLIGSLVALIGPNIALRPVRECLAALGLAAILVSIFLFDAGTPFPGWAALLPCAGAAAIVAFGQGTWAGRLLSTPILVGIGVISYSLYLYHWPTIIFARLYLVESHLPASAAVLAIAAAFVLATMSWRYIELPFRDKRRFSRRSVFLLAAVAILVPIALSVIVKANGGFRDRLPPGALAYLDASADRRPPNPGCPSGQITQGCYFGDRPVVAIWGDSHASRLKLAIEQILPGGSGGILLRKGGCPPLLGFNDYRGAFTAGCPEFRDRVVRFLKARPDIRTVFLVGRWNAFATGKQPDAGVRNTQLSYDSETVRMSPDENLRVFERSLYRTLAVLREAGKSVVILGPVPEQRWDVPTTLALGAMHNREQKLLMTGSEVRRWNARTEAILKKAAAAAGGQYVSLIDAFCHETCMVLKDGDPLYTDNNHPSETAARTIVAPYLKSRLGAR